MASGDTAWGFYGLAVRGLAEPSPYTFPVDPSWPTMHIDRQGPPPRPTPRPRTLWFRSTRASMWFSEQSMVEIEREPLAARFHTSEVLSDAALAHPYLAIPVAFAGRWLGRYTLHGGAFLWRDRAWALCGAKQAGKSSTLASLAHRGVPILSDDLLVTDGRTLYSGPRTLDLREGPAQRFGGQELGLVGARDRWRLTPDAAPAKAELGGVVHLHWGDASTIEALGFQERGSALLAHRVFADTPVDDRLAMLDLATLPAWRLHRRRDLDAIDEGVDQMLDVLSQAC